MLTGALVHTPTASAGVLNFVDGDSMVTEGEVVGWDLELVVVVFDERDVDDILLVGVVVLDMDRESEWR
jgi:hypothetical protein